MWPFSAPQSALLSPAPINASVSLQEASNSNEESVHFKSIQCATITVNQSTSDSAVLVALGPRAISLWSATSLIMLAYRERPTSFIQDSGGGYIKCTLKNKDQLFVYTKKNYADIFSIVPASRSIAPINTNPSGIFLIPKTFSAYDLQYEGSLDPAGNFSKSPKLSSQVFIEPSDKSDPKFENINGFLLETLEDDRLIIKGIDWIVNTLQIHQIRNLDFPAPNSDKLYAFSHITGKFALFTDKVVSVYQFYHQSNQSSSSSSPPPPPFDPYKIQQVPCEAPLMIKWIDENYLAILIKTQINIINVQNRTKVSQICVKIQHTVLDILPNHNGTALIILYKGSDLSTWLHKIDLLKIQDNGLLLGESQVLTLFPSSRHRKITRFQQQHQQHQPRFTWQLRHLPNNITTIDRRLTKLTAKSRCGNYLAVSGISGFCIYTDIGSNNELIKFDDVVLENNVAVVSMTFVDLPNSRCPLLVVQVLLRSENSKELWIMNMKMKAISINQLTYRQSVQKEIHILTSCAVGHLAILLADGILQIIRIETDESSSKDSFSIKIDYTASMLSLMQTDGISPIHKWAFHYWPRLADQQVLIIQRGESLMNVCLAYDRPEGDCEGLAKQMYKDGVKSFHIWHPSITECWMVVFLNSSLIELWRYPFGNAANVCIPAPEGSAEAFFPEIGGGLITMISGEIIRNKFTNEKGDSTDVGEIYRMVVDSTISITPSIIHWYLLNPNISDEVFSIRMSNCILSGSIDDHERDLFLQLVMLKILESSQSSIQCLGTPTRIESSPINTDICLYLENLGSSLTPKSINGLYNQVAQLKEPPREAAIVLFSRLKRRHVASQFVPNRLFIKSVAEFLRRIEHEDAIWILDILGPFETIFEESLGIGLFDASWSLLRVRQPGTSRPFLLFISALLKPSISDPAPSITRILSMLEAILKLARELEIDLSLKEPDQKVSNIELITNHLVSKAFWPALSIILQYLNINNLSIGSQRPLIMRISQCMMFKRHLMTPQISPEDCVFLLKELVKKDSTEIKPVSSIASMLDCRFGCPGESVLWSLIVDGDPHPLASTDSASLDFDPNELSQIIKDL